MVLLPYDRYQRLLSTSAETTIDSTTPSESPPMETNREDRTEPASDHLGDTGVVGTEDSADYLVLQFPKAMRQRARSLLHYIRPHLSWNDRGEVTLNQRHIPGSNIVDLLKVHLKDYKDFHPPGEEAFGELLLKINVPRSVLSPRVRHKSGVETLPPPPGIPALPPKDDRVQRKIKWRRL